MKAYCRHHTSPSTFLEIVARHLCLFEDNYFCLFATLYSTISSLLSPTPSANFHNPFYVIRCTTDMWARTPLSVRQAGSFQVYIGVKGIIPKR